MKMLSKVPGAGFLLLVAASAQGQQPAGQRWDSIAHVFGAATNVNANTYRYHFPRTDLHVQINAVYNHNLDERRDALDRHLDWRFASNQLLVKVQHAVRY